MTTIDYHEFTVADALDHAERYVSVVRIKRRTDDAEFITGYGEIRVQLMERLQSLGLNPSYKLGNEGVIVCTIE